MPPCLLNRGYVRTNRSIRQLPKLPQCCCGLLWAMLIQSETMKVEPALNLRFQKKN